MTTLSNHDEGTAATDHAAVIRSARMRIRDNGAAYVDVGRLLATADALLAENERLSEALAVETAWRIELQKIAKGAVDA